MDISGLPLFSVMKAKLNYLSQRQSVLAQNVANVDTPNYQAQDVKAPDFKSMVQGASKSSGHTLQLATTNAKHVQGMSHAVGMYATEKRASTYDRNPNGNNVSVEEEMMLVASNQAEYQKTLGLYKKTVDLFKAAIGKPSGA